MMSAQMPIGIEFQEFKGYRNKRGFAMKYEFTCENCEDSSTLRLDPNYFREIKDGGVEKTELEEHSDQSLCSCERATYQYQFNPDGLDVCWKGFQWAGKNYKEKKYRKKRSKKLGKKQKEEHFVPELKPNYKGQRTESWREAKNKAKKDERPRLDKTYDPLIEGEQEED